MSLKHLIQRTDSLENNLMLGKIEGGRRGQQKMRWLDGITNLIYRVIMRVIEDYHEELTFRILLLVFLLQQIS